ncbi:kelch domain-containing protein 4 isoform X1 [Nomia melanderi]|uniref:kelch domain-containing protein 4 isoform X1 n=3 Tax=Nomia melanderi TaxID=2448451 RepID=UPI003FCEC2D9
MGKKDKNKKKISGSVKTALKTEKKLSIKQKKEIASLGEDDIENVIAQIEKEEARRQRIVEKTVGPPSRRVNFTLTAHPFKDELIMFGGEFHDGRTTFVYGDMFTYNICKNDWTVIKAPGAPPPRCGHQAVATPINKGELWIFGGEFSSPSESQFYHYKDLWVYRIGDKKWEKILAPGGPSARSGHRMVHLKRQLIVFGGFHDNLRDYKYFNDVHIFNLESYAWQKIELSGNPPLPRSGCIMLPTSEKILVYGGYSKEKVKKDLDKGYIHSDVFVMTPEKNDQSGLKWKWASVKQSGVKPSPRCSMSAVLVQPNLAYIFGGVFDEDDEEELNGIFHNDLMALDLEKFQWHTVTLCGKKNTTVRHRRRKVKETDGEENNSENEDTEVTESYPVPTQSVIADGIFTMTIGPSPTSVMQKSNNTQENVFVPCPRINPGLVVKHNILYMYGGMFEEGDRQYTLNDFYTLDCRKLDEWRTIIADDLSSQVWFDSSSSSSEEGNIDSTDEDTNNSENEYIDTDEH